MRCLLVVMCTHPVAKEALTLHLARSESHKRYFGCNLMHRKVLASSHQHLMAEAPAVRRLRYLLLVMCTYPVAKKALTLHLARGEGRERYFGCNLMQRKVSASSHQH